MPAPTAVGRMVAGALFALAAPVHAVIVHLPGATVDFYYNDAQPGMAAYGSLTAVGDSIFATPTDFLAESLNGTPDSFSALGTVTVVLKSGYRFDSVTVAQQGDYQMNGSGASVSSNATLDVTDSADPLTTVSTPLGSSSDFSLQDNQLHPWSSEAFVNLGTTLWNGVNSIELTLDSSLTAATAAGGESALIQNKLVGSGLVTVVTTPVPLPASLWLFGAGLGLLASRCRRGKQ